MKLNKNVDIGTVVMVNEFTATIKNCKTRKQISLAKKQYKTAKACLKGEHKRSTLSDEEYNTAISELNELYSEIEKPSQRKEN